MKKAIIIGATSGLGKGLAEKLTAENYKVGITGRRVELLEKLKIQKPNLFYPKTFDITDTTKIVENRRLKKTTWRTRFTNYKFGNWRPKRKT